MSNTIIVAAFILSKIKITAVGKPQAHSWTKLRIERLKIMSEHSTVQLKAIIPGFEEMRYGLIIRPWEE